MLRRRRERAISTPASNGMQHDQQRTSKQEVVVGGAGGGGREGGRAIMPGCVHPEPMYCRDTYGQQEPRHCSPHSNRTADLHASTTARSARGAGKLRKSIADMDPNVRVG